MKDALNFVIESDGTISIKTGDVSPTNHVSADQLLALIRKLAGGEYSTKDRTDVQHTHSHGHEHADGHTHNHA
jgi:hypothetical protein